MFSVGSREPSTSHTLEQWGGGGGGEGGTMFFRQLLRARKARASSDGHWENSASSPTNSSLLLKTTEDRTVTLFSWSKPSWDLFPPSPESHGICRIRGSGGKGTVHMWLEVPAWVLGYPRLSCQAIPDAGLFAGEYHSEVVLFGTFSNRWGSWVGAHNPPVQLSVDPIQAVCDPFLSVNPLFKRKLVLHFYWQVILFFLTYTCNQNVLP